MFSFIVSLFILVNSLSLSVIEHYCNFSKKSSLSFAKSASCNSHEESCCSEQSEESNQEELSEKCCSESTYLLSIDLGKQEKYHYNCDWVADCSEILAFTENLDFHTENLKIKFKTTGIPPPKLPFFLAFQNLRL